MFHNIKPNYNLLVYTMCGSINKCETVIVGIVRLSYKQNKSHVQNKNVQLFTRHPGPET